MVDGEYKVKPNLKADEEGPFAIERLRLLYKNKQIHPGFLYYDEKIGNWVSFRNNEYLFDTIFRYVNVDIDREEALFASDDEDYDADYQEFERQTHEGESSTLHDIRTFLNIYIIGFAMLIIGAALVSVDLNAFVDIIVSAKLLHFGEHPLLVLAIGNWIIAAMVLNGRLTDMSSIRFWSALSAGFLMYLFWTFHMPVMLVLSGIVHLGIYLVTFTHHPRNTLINGFFTLGGAGLKLLIGII